MSNQLTREMRDEILMNDLGWLGEITFHRIGGKLMMGDSSMPFSVAHVMGEKEFTRKWMLQFAVGNSVGNGESYFDLTGWMAISESGARSVAVVTDEETPRLLMVIPPLFSNNMGPREEAILRRASILINASSKDNLAKTNPSANLNVAQKLQEVLGNVPPKTYADLVLPEFFAKHRIIPRVEQKIYYIRDVIREKGTTLSTDIERARVIMYRDHEGGKHPQADVDFMMEFSHGRYVMKEEVDPSLTTGSEPEKPAQPPVNEDPLTC